MLPSPPHWATSRPPGRRAPRRRSNSRSMVARSSGRWPSRGSRRRAGQARARAGPSTCSSARSPRRRRAASIIEADSSTAMTRPCGRRSSSASVIRPGPAAGVEHQLVSAQLQAAEHVAPERLHRRPRCGRSSCRPTPAWHTDVRYHVLLATSSAITFESCPPCQAVGETGGSASGSTISRAPGICAAQASPTASGWPGSSLVAAGHDDRRDGDRAERAERLEGPRAGHGFQRVGDRLGVLVGPEALAQDRLDCRAYPRRQRAQVIGGDEAIHSALAKARGKAVPRSRRRRARRDRRRA